jgi:hypothetical protein
MKNNKTYNELMIELNDNLYELFLPIYKFIKWILSILVNILNKVNKNG